MPGFIFKVPLFLEEKKKRKGVKKPYHANGRSHKEGQISFLYFQLNQPLKKIQGAVQGCWSNREHMTDLQSNGHSGEQSVCFYTPSSQFQLEHVQGPFADFFVQCCSPS